MTAPATPTETPVLRKRAAIVIASLLAIVLVIGYLTLFFLSRIGVSDDVRNVRLRAKESSLTATRVSQSFATDERDVSVALGVDPSALQGTASADGSTFCIQVRARHVLAERTLFFTADATGTLTEVKTCG